MENKGFTMIELLAIITVLATILLVSFPTLINMTRRDKERKYSDLEKTLCKAGETYIYNNKDLFPEINKAEEIFYLRISNLMEEELVNKSETNPKTEKSITSNLLKYEVKSDKSLSCTYLDHSLGTLLKDNGDGKLSVGDKYEYEVKPGEKYNFYVLSIENDSVNLIMDRNICEDGTTDYREDNNYCRYAWYDDGDNPVNYSNDTNLFGPVTAMTVLGNATRNWTNVPNINLEYNDVIDNAESVCCLSNTDGGYTGMTITDGIGYITKKDGATQIPIALTDNKPIKARLPKNSEIYKNHCDKWSGTCPVWLVENLRYDGIQDDKYSLNSANISGTSIYNIYGYWLLSSNPGDSDYARNVTYSGSMLENSTSVVISIGIRPVITVPKLDLS